MKKLILKTLLLFLYLYIFSASSLAQQQMQGIKQIFDITMDKLGNATVEVSTKLNASQWDMFKRNIGNNTSILKRAMEKALPKYYLSNFDYSEEQMERTYKIKFNILGLAKVDAKNKWEAQLETKNPDVTKLSEKEFIINSDMMSDGMLFQQTQKIHLPSGASNAKIEKDSFGKALITYSTGGGFAAMATSILGLLFILAGVWTFYKNRISSKNNLRVATKENVIIKDAMAS